MGRKSQTSFTYYTFRFDVDWQVESILLNQLKSYIISEFPKYAIFREISDKTKKPHLQGKIGKALSIEQIRKNLRKQFPNVFTESNYSIADIKTEGYDSYICKSQNVFCNNIFTDEEIKNFNDVFEEVKQELNSKKKRSKAKSFLQNVVDQFIEQNLDDVNTIIHYTIYSYKLTEIELEQMNNSKKRLFKFLMKNLGKSAKIFDTNILQRMYNGILNSLIQSNDNASEVFSNKILENIQL